MEASGQRAVRVGLPSTSSTRCNGCWLLVPLSFTQVGVGDCHGGGHVIGHLEATAAVAQLV